jgi:Cu(I)/Ag(I) efflux system membrane protein CusA/SilA
MAKVILGGLLTSTLLNGFIIPVMYLITSKKADLEAASEEIMID